MPRANTRAQNATAAAQQQQVNLANAAAVAAAAAAAGGPAAAAGNGAGAGGDVPDNITALLTALMTQNQQQNQLLNERLEGLQRQLEQSQAATKYVVAGNQFLSTAFQYIGECLTDPEAQSQLLLLCHACDALSAAKLRDDADALRLLLGKVKQTPARADDLLTAAYEVAGQLQAVRGSSLQAQPRAANRADAPLRKRGVCHDCGHAGHWAGDGKCPNIE